MILTRFFLHRVRLHQRLSWEKGATDDVTGHEIPFIRGKPFKIHEVRWPLEVTDGDKKVFWAALSGEPEHPAKGMSLKDRAAHSGYGWIATIRTSGE